jgi:hypothetical protein
MVSAASPCQRPKLTSNYGGLQSVSYDCQSVTLTCLSLTIYELKFSEERPEMILDTRWRCKPTVKLVANYQFPNCATLAFLVYLLPLVKLC